MIFDIISDPVWLLIDTRVTHSIFTSFSGKLSSRSITVVGVERLESEILYSFLMCQVEGHNFLRIGKFTEKRNGE